MSDRDCVTVSASDLVRTEPFSEPRNGASPEVTLHVLDTGLVEIC
jgi:hypothetical protein